VKKNAADLQRMLTFSKGSRDVPIIVEDGKLRRVALVPPCAAHNRLWSSVSAT